MTGSFNIEVKNAHLAQVYSNTVNSLAIMTAYGLTNSINTHFFD